eukprot:jgi/Chlat1/136/Chrsp1S03095
MDGEWQAVAMAIKEQSVEIDDTQQQCIARLLVECLRAHRPVTVNMSGGGSQAPQALQVGYARSLNMARDYSPHYNGGVRELVQNWMDQCLRLSRTHRVGAWRVPAASVTKLREVGISAFHALLEVDLPPANQPAQCLGLCVGFGRKAGGQGFIAVNFATTLSLDVMLLGHSTSRDNDYNAGNFGEGMKVQINRLIASGASARYVTGNNLWNFEYRRDPGFTQDSLNLVITPATVPPSLRNATEADVLYDRAYEGKIFLHGIQVQYSSWETVLGIGLNYTGSTSELQSFGVERDRSSISIPALLCRVLPAAVYQLNEQHKNNVPHSKAAYQRLCKALYNAIDTNEASSIASALQAHAAKSGKSKKMRALAHGLWEIFGEDHFPTRHHLDQDIVEMLDYVPQIVSAAMLDIWKYAGLLSSIDEAWSWKSKELVDKGEPDMTAEQRHDVQKVLSIVANSLAIPVTALLVRDYNNRFDNVIFALHGQPLRLVIQFKYLQSLERVHQRLVAKHRRTMQCQRTQCNRGACLINLIIFEIMELKALRDKHPDIHKDIMARLIAVNAPALESIGQLPAGPQEMPPASPAPPRQQQQHSQQRGDRSQTPATPTSPQQAGHAEDEWVVVDSTEETTDHPDTRQPEHTRRVQDAVSGSLGRHCRDGHVQGVIPGGPGVAPKLEPCAGPRIDLLKSNYCLNTSSEGASMPCHVYLPAGKQLSQEQLDRCLGLFGFLQLFVQHVFAQPNWGIMIFYDEESPVKAFNRQGELWFNAGFYQGNNTDMIVDWFLSVCHEVAHNSVRGGCAAWPLKLAIQGNSCRFTTMKLVESSVLEAVCTHCGSTIPAGNLALHEVHCRRNLERCQLCGGMIPRSSKQEHFQQQHAQMPCSKCGTQLEVRHMEDHESNACPRRLIACEFCELPCVATDLSEHENTCGSRTELCHNCNKYVMLRSLRDHEQLHLWELEANEHDQNGDSRHDHATNGHQQHPSLHASPRRDAPLPKRFPWLLGIAVVVAFGSAIWRFERLRRQSSGAFS